MLSKALLGVAVWSCAASLVVAQTPTAAPVPPPSSTVPTDIAVLAAEMNRLALALEALRAQLDEARREGQDLREQLATVRAEIDKLRGQSADGSPQAQEQELLEAKIEDLEQTKVESGSKYHVRLNGLALVNLTGTRGAVDSMDLPLLAMPRDPGESGGSFSAGVRQSSIGLEVFGPTIGRAHTAGSIALDFFAGFPATVDGLSSGLVRLRTATIRADWANTSIAAGQDTLFFSPRSPSSLSSSAYPALASAGNLWTWTPAVNVEHRFALSPVSKMVVQAGILDALTGEPPASEYTRLPTAGERTGLPATAFRVAWQHGADERVTGLAFGGYYARQNWGFDRKVHAWAATGDWGVPLGQWLTLSGEIYRGRAIGGLGGGAVASVLFDGPPANATSTALALKSVGGWSQLKLKKPSGRVEINAAFGGEHASLPGMGLTQQIQSAQEPSVSRNASGFINTIYQLRSNVLFSLEYRRLWTTGFGSPQRTADHISLTSGIVF